MSLTVTLYGLDNNANDKQIGTITLTKGKLSVNVPSLVMRDNLLAAKIYDPNGPITSNTPEKWIKSLYKHYKSAYLRATKAVSS